MDIYQLNYAVTLAKYCNFSVAADELFITQPSLSLQIQKIEEELGFSVFFRNRRVVRLTHAGEQFIDDARKVLREFESLQKNAAKTADALKRKIRFGTNSLRSVLILKSITRFLRAFPQTDFSFVETLGDIDLIRMVRNRELSLAFAIIPLDISYKDEIVVIPLQECHVCAVMSENDTLAKREYVTLEDLLNKHLLFPSSGSIIKELVNEAYDKSDHKPNSVMDVNTIDARKVLIRDGAVAFTPSIEALWGFEPDIVMLPIKPYIKSLLALIYPVDQEIGLVENALIDILRKDYQDESARNSLLHKARS